MFKNVRRKLVREL